MSIMQRLILACVPKFWRADIIADSQAWKLICPCGGIQSIWEIGGIRYKAFGNPRTWLPCRKCGKRTWQRLEKRESVSPPA